jgi:signal transduction histidine kinase/DNA-binding response OmpR family regulator
VEPSSSDALEPSLEPSDQADIRRITGESLARQSVASVYGHWVLAAVVLSTSSWTRVHPAGALCAALWFLLVGAERLIVAKSFHTLWQSRSGLWTRLFRGGLLLSSMTWGLGGATLLAVSGFDRESLLVLLSLSGISAAGIASTSGDLGLLRLHIGILLLPGMVAGLVFMPGSGRLAIGFAVVTAAYATFLWIQATHAHAAFYSSLVKAKFMERQAVELDEARRDSLDANRAKSAFLANMSHEIRTPMAAVIGYADLLLEPTLGPSDRVNYVQTIRRNAEHLLTLVNDILDISKIEAGKMTVESIATSPSQTIVEVASLMRVRAVEKNLALDVEYQGPIPERIQSDPTRLRQILVNFVGNAVKFTDKGRVRVRVRCERPESADPRLAIEVSDTGIGMTREEIDKLFTAFTQADASTTRRFGGSGLGLVISKRLAELLGGEIDVESTVGRGSLFRLTVPTGPLVGVKMVEGRLEAGMGDGPARTVRHVPSLPAPCSVLLAEDGHDNQVLIKTFLVAAGATVRVVGDGQLAVEQANAALAAGKPYDLVLMDMQMPVLDGYSATSKLRQMGYRGPIVAITAHAMTGDRERCESAGCDDYLTKPVDRAQLVATVARFTGRVNPTQDALVSTLVDDADMQEIIREFVRDLPGRSAAILRASRASDIETLKRLAHQLKGAAGGYGFPRITEAAAEVEQAVNEGLDRPILESRAEALANLCRRVRAA